MRRTCRTSLSLLTLAALATACSGGALVGGAVGKASEPATATPPVTVATHDVAAICGDTSVHDVALASDDDTIAISGELCPAPTSSNVRVALLVDTSKSMREADPQLEGRCHRLDAARKLVDALRAQTSNAATVRLDLVHFSAAATVVKHDVPLDDADTLTTVETLCAGETSETGFTNYAAAFTALKELTPDTALAHIAYLVTDGVPTMGGDAAPGFVADVEESKRRLKIHGDAARDALTTLNAQNAAKPWSLNALFFGGKTDFTAFAFDPNAFLAALTGTSARVAVVDDATGLADAITTLPFGVPALDAAKTLVTLTADGAQAPATLQALEPDPSGAFWRFRIAPFAASAGRTLALTVSSLDAAGGTTTATVSVAVKAP